MNTPLRRILCASLCLGSLLFSAPGSASWFWTQSDWSGGTYSSADSVNPEIEAGELVLTNDPDRLILAFDATDWDGVWALQAYQGLLYAGVCDYPDHADFGDIMIYDYVSDSVHLDMPVQEEGINVFKVRDGTLYSPGTDALGPVFIGNIYYNQGNGWTVKSTVPIAAHVYDLEVWQGKLWVSTGCFDPPDYPAILYSSDDMGDTWTEELVIQPNPPTTFFRRLYGMGVWQGSLFVNSDFEAPQGKVVYQLTGTQIIAHTVEGPGDHCFCGFLEWNGKLAVLTRTILDFYNGQTWTYQVLPLWSGNFSTRAMAKYGNRLYIGGIEGLISSANPESGAWAFSDIDPVAGREIEDLTVLHGRLYAGTVLAGEVFVTPAAGSGTLVSQSHAFPAAICEGTVSWTSLEPPGTSLAFQLRSAPSESELAGAPFLGPDGSAGTWYETPGTALAAAHCGHRWFQYKVRLLSADPRLAPVLEEFSLEVDNSGTGVGAEGAWPASGLEAWPNPFVSELRIALAGPASAGGHLRVFDLRGRCVRDLGPAAAGTPVWWDGKDQRGASVSAGVYLVQVESAGGQSQSERVVRLR